VKKRINPGIKAHLIRGACYLLLLLAVCVIPFALAQRNATSQSVSKLGSASKRLVGVGNALPATIIVVTNTNDSGPGSLRNALAIANDGDTIDATGVSGTILLTSGELQITHNVTINGPGVGNLTVNGNATSRVFENFASNVIIFGFTITNGLPPIGDTNGGGGILNHGGLTVSDSGILNNNAGFANPFCADGGGINTVGGTLTVRNSVISSNDGAGGGISADGATVTVSNSTINGNGGACGPGGIGSLGNGTLTVLNSTISGNTADGCGDCFGSQGGGIGSFGSGSVTVMNSTISGNSSHGGIGGGGVYNSGETLTLTNSTISGNFVDAPGTQGGGIWNGGNLTVTNSTISGNSAITGGGILNGTGGAAQIGDTILNAGPGGTIANAGTFTSLGYSLAGDNGGGVLTGPGDQINTDPVLGPLQDNGGPTFTHALLPGSPAIDAGDPNFTPPPFYDQRGPGFPRVVNGRIDKGSFEVQSGGTPTPTPTATPTATPTPTPTPRATPTPRPRPTPAPRPDRRERLKSSLWLFEVAYLLVRLDHAARVVVNANHSIM
jgi:hypothetical protein